ncbi:unnamed protein product [Linum tenue]|uniref:Gnk2-homologous domain-containing protein n=1 Tax=Linum tenue TaxID=586396 RepID=A0AAV0RUL3_9ROSI|nr:unnamed protein product [Linum tenue]
MALSLLLTVVVADDPSAIYCSDDKYFKGDHELKASIKAVLGQLLEQTTASGDSDIETKLQHPADKPRVYGAAFCEKSPPESCKHCLRAAKKELLHGCDHTAGAEFYSELCYLRFEIYNFLS